MQYVKPFKGSTRYHVWSAISAIAALLERRVWINLGGLGQIYPNLFITLCGGPGTGKSTSSRVACDFIKKLNKALGEGSKGVFFGPDKVTPAALFTKFRQTIKTVIPEGGAPFEQCAMYLHSTELSTMIRDIGGGSLSDDLLKFYDCDDLFEKDLVGGTIRVPNPCLNFLADTTPSFLSGFLPREESGTGLTARIIFATELGRVDMDEEVPDGDKRLHQQILNGMARVYRMSGAYRISDGAKSYWSGFYRDHQERLFTLNDGSYMRNFYARKATHVRKVAMVLSASRNSDRIILADDYRRAIELIEEAEPFMDKSFGVKDFSKTDDAVKQILDAIPFDPTEIPRHALIDKLYASGLSGKLQDFEGMMNLLVESRKVKVRRENITEIFYRRVL